MKLAEIQIRDPFVLADGGSYHLFGSTDPDIWRGPATGFDTYSSTDLVDWEGPVAAFRPEPDFWSHTQYWAPEVDAYDGGYIMLATFTAEGRRRGTQALRAERPEGPYRPWSDGPLTPADWECLDGTLYIEHGVPYLVFCHEWKQTFDGRVMAVELTSDLRGAAGAPFELFAASEAPWARPLSASSARTEVPCYVTDGPFLHRTRDGLLCMLWSSMGDHGYALGVAISKTGSVAGPWRQESEALWPSDGGHGMVFRGPGDRLLLALHSPNRTPDERATFVEIVETEGGLRLASTTAAP